MGYKFNISITSSNALNAAEDKIDLKGEVFNVISYKILIHNESESKGQEVNDVSTVRR